MRTADSIGWVVRVLLRHRLRTLLLLLAVSVGVGAVIVLTSLGDSARRYVTDEFRSLGTELLIITPGKSETSGSGRPSFLGATARDLTLVRRRCGD